MDDIYLAPSTNTREKSSVQNVIPLLFTLCMCLYHSNPNSTFTDVCSIYTHKPARHASFHCIFVVVSLHSLELINIQKLPFFPVALLNIKHKARIIVSLFPLRFIQHANDVSDVCVIYLVRFGMLQAIGTCIFVGSFSCSWHDVGIQFTKYISNDYLYLISNLN